jgi:chemotaxis protein methyltransferase CheR
MINTHAHQSSLALSATQFRQLRDQLERYCGVYVDEARRKVIEQAVAQRLAANGHTLDAYSQQLAAPAGHDELRQLAELVLNHETSFFRNGSQFEALRREILPALERHKPAGQALRIWSAGCATGEEAYSLAISALETLGAPPPRPVQIWATDLSASALARARQGVYSGRALGQVRPAILARYFEPCEPGYRLTDEVRQMVRFEQRNLLEPFPPAAQGVDIIFCENVTIYFQLETCRDLIERFYAALPEGGMLFLGFSETLWQVYDRFQLEQIGGAFVYVKRTPLPVELRRTPRPLAATRQLPRAAGRAPAHGLDEQPAAALARARALLAQGQGDEALAALRQIAPQHPSYPAALALLARIHADRGELDTALAEARRAIDVGPPTDEAYLLLGLIALRQGEQEQAVQQLERARYLDGNSPQVRFHLAEAYRQIGRAAEARREYANTLRALGNLADDQLLDGVTVAWLREACRKNV